MTWHGTILVHFAAPALFFSFDRRGTTALGGLGFGSSVSTASFMSPAPISLAADIHKQGLNGCQHEQEDKEDDKNKEVEEQKGKETEGGGGGGRG